MTRRGDWIQTRSGVRYWPLDPSSTEVRVEDVAWALSGINRYGAMAPFSYSVAQHSVIIAELLYLSGHDEDTCLWGLFHDGPEAYLGDVPRPLKKQDEYAFYREVESMNMACIAEAMKLSERAIPKIVKEYDERIIANEKAILFPNAAWEFPPPKPLPVVIEPWSREHAFDRFMSMYSGLLASQKAWERRTRFGAG